MGELFYLYKNQIHFNQKIFLELKELINVTKDKQLIYYNREKHYFSSERGMKYNENKYLKKGYKIK